MMAIGKRGGQHRNGRAKTRQADRGQWFHNVENHLCHADRSTSPCRKIIGQWFPGPCSGRPSSLGLGCFVQQHDDGIDSREGWTMSDKPGRCIH